MKPITLPLIIIITTLLTPVSNASQFKQYKNLFSDNLSVNIYSGWLASQSKEYVFGKDANKVSELD